MGRSVWMLVLLVVPTMVGAQVAPPIGFHFYSLEGTANAETLLSPVFLKKPIAWGDITAVSGETLTLDGEGLGQVTPGACHIQVQSGSYGGLVSKVLGVQGSDLVLEDAVEGVLQVGDSLVVNPFWTLNDLFEHIEGAIASGGSPDDSDLVTLINPVSQVARSYFLKEAGGWRQVGDEEAGDQGGVSFPFYQGFFFLRRSPERLDIWASGRVPFVPHRFQPIHPGRNLITVAVAGNSDLVEDYFFVPGQSSFPVEGGTSAADADVIALSSQSELLPRFYYHESDGWKVIGRETLVSGSEVPVAAAADYHRAGPKAFLKVRSLRFEPSASVAFVSQSVQLAVSPTTGDGGAGPAGETDASSGPAGEIEGPGEETEDAGEGAGAFVGPGGETGGDGSTTDQGTPGSEGPMPSDGGGVGPSPDGIVDDREELWGEVSPVPFEGKLTVDDGGVRMTFHWDSEVAKAYGLQFRTVPGEAWAQVGHAVTASESVSDTETVIVTDGGEFRVVEVLNQTGGS